MGALERSRTPLVSVVIPTRDRCRAALHDAALGLGAARRESRDRGRRRWLAGRHRQDGCSISAIPGSGWFATSRRGARAALAIAASRRPEEPGSPFSTMMTYGRRTNSHASCRPCRSTRREWAYTGDVVVDGELRIVSGAPPPSPEELMESLGRHNSVPAGASNVIVSSRLLCRSRPLRSRAEANCRLGHVAPSRPRGTARMGSQPLGGELHSCGQTCSRT